MNSNEQNDNKKDKDIDSTSVLDKLAKFKDHMNSSFETLEVKDTVDKVSDENSEITNISKDNSSDLKDKSFDKDSLLSRLAELKRRARIAIEEKEKAERKLEEIRSSEESEKTEEVKESEKTEEVKESEKTEEVKESEKTEEVRESEKTEEVKESEKTEEVKESEKTEEVTTARTRSCGCSPARAAWIPIPFPRPTSGRT